MNTLCVSHGHNYLYFTSTPRHILVTYADGTGAILWSGRMSNDDLWDGKGWHLKNILRKISKWEREESVIAPQ